MSNDVIEITETLKAKMAVIEALRAEREALFANFEGSKDRIGELYYEIELKELDYLYLKREQLNALKEKYSTPHEEWGSKFNDDLLAHATKVEKINETCIGLATKRLKEAGFLE